MQTSNAMFANSSSVLTSQVQPVKNSMGFRLLDPADSAQTVALNQHSHCIQKYVLLGSQSFKECSFVGAKSVVTGGAVKTTLSMAIDPDVVSSYPSYEWDLHLMCVAATKDLLDVGRNLVIVALVGAHLHIRIFDASGKKVVDKAESELVTNHPQSGWLEESP